MKRFIQELQRRNVIKSALAYLVVAWLLTQVLAILIPTFDLSEDLLRIAIIILAIVFPCWIVFAWVYEITPDGLKKTNNVPPEYSIARQTSNQLNYVIIAGLIIAIGLLIRSNLQSPEVIIQKQKFASIPKDTVKSIAVLAFADMSPEKNQAYFSDGISEEILNLLTKIPDLKVISRTSSFSYKDKGMDIKQIGEELGVGYILEGSIRKYGSTFRITTQLIDAMTGVGIWSATFDRDMEDILKVQGEIAMKVTEQLKVALFDTELVAKTIDMNAYKLYIQAVQMTVENSAESNTNAITLLKRSIAIDSAYAPAWADLSYLYYQAGYTLLTMPDELAMQQGRLAAKKAIALDSESVLGYISLAFLENAAWNFEEANSLLENALVLEPNNPRAITAKAEFAVYCGKPELAIDLALKLIELDPLNNNHYLMLSQNYWMNGNYKKAEESLREYLLYHPNSGWGNGMMGTVQLSLGNPEHSLEYIEKDNHLFWRAYKICPTVFAMGNIEQANQLLEDFIAEWGDQERPFVADVYAFRKDKDEAFTWLELAYENKDSSLLRVLNYPAMQNLWGDPRWNTFIHKLKLTEEHGFHLD